jgi:hypothetical protein
MEKQDWQGKHLDKDILLLGNKAYSENTCCFVSDKINYFASPSRQKISSLPIGVCLHKRIGMYQAYCKNPFTNKIEHLGYFNDDLEAHEKWRMRKDEIAKIISSDIEIQKVADSLFSMFSESNSKYWLSLRHSGEEA